MRTGRPVARGSANVPKFWNRNRCFRRWNASCDRHGMAKDSKKKADVDMDPGSRTPKAADMTKRKRGPSAGDSRRREEFRHLAESMKGHKK